MNAGRADGGDASSDEAAGRGRGAQGSDSHSARREARRLALSALFEADFGHRTPLVALQRQLDETALGDETVQYARELVEAVTLHRPEIDERIEVAAPQYPVVQLARIDRALLRSALGELLHCPATPARVAISEWVELARTYSGEPARRLLNGVLGRIARDTAAARSHRSSHATGGSP